MQAHSPDPRPAHDRLTPPTFSTSLLTGDFQQWLAGAGTDRFDSADWRRLFREGEKVVFLDDGCSCNVCTTPMLAGYRIGFAYLRDLGLSKTTMRRVATMAMVAAICVLTAI